MKKLYFILFSLFAFTFFTFSCSTRTYNIEINEIGTHPNSLIETLPLKVGVYYGNDFSTFETTQKVDIVRYDGATMGAFENNIKIGKANIALFDYILSVVFEKVTPLQYLPNGFEHLNDIDLIIEPTVHSYTHTNFTADGVYIHIII